MSKLYFCEVDCLNVSVITSFYDGKATFDPLSCASVYTG